MKTASKTVSIKKKDLVEAIGQSTHAGFAGKGWSWQVIFDVTDSQAEGKVALVNPDTDDTVNYRLVNEDGYPVLMFADMDGYAWGEGDTDTLPPMTDIKDVEAIRVPKETREAIESKLRKQVAIGKDNFRVEYF